MKLFTTSVALLALFTGAAAMAAHLVASTTNTTDVLWFSDGSPTGGHSHLTRADARLVAVVEAASLKPGDAHTLWWVVFNEPAGCTFPCGEDDLFNPDGTLNEAGVGNAQIAIGNASGNVVKSDGTLEFGAQLEMGVNTPGHQVLFGAGFGPIMLINDPDAVEVHLIGQTHGKGRGGPPLLKQLSMVDSNCTPNCADLQFAVHLP